MDVGVGVGVSWQRSPDLPNCPPPLTSAHLNRLPPLVLLLLPVCLPVLQVPKNARATPRYLLKIQTEVDAMQQLGGSLDAVFLQVRCAAGGGQELVGGRGRSRMRGGPIPPS